MRKRNFKTHLLLLAAVLAFGCSKGADYRAETPIAKPPKNQEAQPAPPLNNRIHPTSGTAMHTPPVVTFDEGRAAGVWADHEAGIQVFRGIPYAAPPVGELRWQAPGPPEPWSGTRDASAFSASCSQPQHSSSFVWRREAFPVSEDCLYLNVWAPAGKTDMPVMVWFHGGAHTSGEGHSLIFDGTRLAREDVVVVTINYRLGALGFLAHPWLVDESPHDAAGNYGLMDKVAALQWVQRNIGALGGDASNVTLFGQSAGSQSVCSLMASPLAQGLFHRAIGQSASCVGSAPGSDAAGLGRGQALVEALDAPNLAALRSVSPARILAATAKTGWSSRDRIVIDGYVLPEPQIDVFRRGAQAAVPLLLGSLSNEGHALIPQNDALSADELKLWLRKRYPGQQQALRTLYQGDASPGATQHAIATDHFMTFGMRRWAEYHEATGHPTYLYFLDHQPPAFHLYMPGSTALNLPGGPRSAGAYHSGDLAYVFGTLNLVGAGWQSSDKELSETLISYWTNFARSGNPNGKGAPPWAPYDGETHRTLVLDPEPRLAAGVRQDKLDAIARAHPK